MNEVTNRWNNFRIKDTSQDRDILFNKIFNVNPEFKDIQEKYDKYEDELKAHIFDGLSEDYTPMGVSCNVRISNMAFKDPKKEIHWFLEDRVEKKQETR